MTITSLTPGVQAQNCSTCKFCRAAASGPRKELQMFCAIRAPSAAPMPMQNGQLQILSIMPPLPPSNWCGEWQAGLVS